MNQNFIILVSTLTLILTGCGAKEAIDSTRAMPPKIDDTNGKIDATNKQITDTNGKIDVTNQQITEMNEKMNTTNQNMASMVEDMKKTNMGIHDQQLSIPLDNLLKPSNWRVLSPIPFDLLPYGKKFAEAATANELMELTYLWLKEITEGLPPVTTDENGDDLPFDPGVTKNTNDEKIARFVSLQIIAAYTSQEKVNEIIAKQIVGTDEAGSQRFEKTAYQFLMMRAEFIEKTLLRESLLANSFANVGVAEESILWAQKLDFISRLNFVDQISYSLTGLIDPQTNKPSQEVAFSATLNPVAAKNIWNKIKDNMSNNLKEIKTKGQTAEENQTLLTRDQERLRKARETVDQALAAWQKKPVP